jgi:hypothetical protein
MLRYHHHLTIVVEAAGIEVGTTHHHLCVIYYGELGMEEGPTTYTHIYATRYRFGDAPTHDMIQQPHIATPWYYECYLYTSLDSTAKTLHNVAWRHEVGRR